MTTRGTSDMCTHGQRLGACGVCHDWNRTKAVTQPQWGQELWHAIPDDDALLAVLTAAGCPAPCVGLVNETGWHLECEERGRKALAVLRGWIAPSGSRQVDE